MIIHHKNENMMVPAAKRVDGAQNLLLTHDVVIVLVISIA
jgi:hypothetical protein